MNDPDTAPGALARHLRRFDSDVSADPHERARDRHRRIALAGVVGVGSRALTAVSLIVALPMVSSHLGSQEVGIWSLLVMAVALLGFADLGLGNGMLNVLSGALGRGDQHEARRAVSSAVVGLLVMGAVGVASIALVVPRVDWPHLLGVDEAAVPELTWAVAAFALPALISIPLGVGQRVHMACQQGWAAALANALGGALALGATAVAAWRDASLPWFVAAMVGGPAAAYGVETTWVFWRSHPDLRPTLAAVDGPTMKRLTRSGLLFFLLAAAGAAAYQSDSIVISHYLGASQVTEYAVGLRLFMLAPSALTAVLMPLWPAYGAAIAQADDAWVRTTLRRSLGLTVVVSGAASAVMVLLAGPLLTFWTPDTPRPSSDLVVALAVWAVVSSFSTATAMYLNGANVIKLQVVAALVMAVANLALSINLVGRWGITGPVWASVITQSLINLLPAMLLIIGPLLLGAPSEPSSARWWRR